MPIHRSCQLLYGAFALYKSLVPCFLLCSAWAWLYLIGLHLVRRAVFLFDVDKQPVRSIGTIGAALLTVCYGLYTAIGPNLSLGSPLSPDEIAHLEQQNSDSTLAGLNAAIRFNPKSPGLLTLRAGAYWQKHNYDAAIADLDAAIGLNPTSPSLFVARGNAYHAKQDYDRAIADNTEAIRLDSSYAIAFNNRGWAYAAKQDYDRAIANYTESIRLDPKYAPAFDNRGNAHSAKQDYDRAIADYAEAIRLNPKYAIAFGDRGRAYIAKQDYDRAIANYTEAIRLDPKFALAFRRRGIAYSAKQDYDHAIASLNDAVRLDPTSTVNRSMVVPYPCSLRCSDRCHRTRDQCEEAESVRLALPTRRFISWPPNTRNDSRRGNQTRNFMSVNGSCCETTAWPPKWA
jgi:tetratricopeptide (TPR) repeat protein